MGKYEEALERAKQGLPIDEVFPELKESEDERIRKFIMECINELRKANAENAEFNGECSDALAYLEKQKEQKPAKDTALQEAFINSKIDYTLEEKCDASDYAEIILPTSVIYGENEEEYKLHKIIEAAFIAGQKKEQQPAEWSEFDKGALKDAICAADRLGNDESFKKSNPNLAKAFRVAKDWLKSLPERFTLQPEQEVVDRTVFDRIADILRWCDLPIGCPIEDFKQSESEREHLLHIVQCVAHRYANSCTYCKEYSRGYQDGLAVPHWKPSEEQMETLKDAFRKDGGNEYRKVINSLYRDLEKLL